jgi:hypothetical protein
VNRLRSYLLRFGKNPKSATTKPENASNKTKTATTLASIVEPTTHDLIGPADKISNLRKYRYYKPVDESKIEYDYRMMREKVFQFNHDYWTQQNLKFLEAKRKYTQKMKIREQLEKMNRGAENQIETKTAAATPEDIDNQKMNEFYKQFLNENFHNHSEYNRQWYRYNFMLLDLAARVSLYRFGKRLRILFNKK